MSVLRRFLGALLLGLVVLTAVGFATGRLASVVTNGVSMQPDYAAGDLVVVMRSDRYSIGDVAAYRVPEAGEVVLHRIVGGGPDGYRMRGDNNDDVDVDTPTADDLIGREVLHVPTIGRWIGSPLALAVLAGAVVALAGWATLPSSRPASTPAPTTPTAPSADPATAATDTSRRRRAAATGTRTRRWRWFHVGLVTLDAAVVAGLVAAFAVPPTVVPPSPVPMHVGALSYGAQVPVSDAYPDGRIETGDSVFARVTDLVDITFRYEGDPVASATARLRLVIEAAGGWSTATSLTSPTPVVAGGAVLQGTIDMAALRGSLQRVEAATGITLTTVQLRVEALVDPDPVDATDVEPVSPYSLAMQFRFDDLGLDLAETSVVTPSLDGPVVTSSEPVRDTVGESRDVGGVPREARRWLAVALLVLIAATATAWPAPREQGDDERDRHTAVPTPVRRVAAVELPPVSMRVQLSSRAELDEIARDAGVPVLERDDGWAVVVTEHALHWWEPPGIPAGPPRWTDRGTPTVADRSAVLHPLEDVWHLAPSVGETPTLRMPVLDDALLPGPLGTPRPADPPGPTEPGDGVDVVVRLRDELMVPRRPLFRARPLPPPRVAPAPIADQVVASRTSRSTDSVRVESTIDEIVAYLTEVADRGGRTDA